MAPFSVEEPEEVVVVIVGANSLIGVDTIMSSHVSLLPSPT